MSDIDHRGHYLMLRKELAKEKSILLIGFMGVGKTTLGKALADKLQREFVDVDHQLEIIYNMKITEIFSHYGAYLRTITASHSFSYLQNLGY